MRSQATRLQYLVLSILLSLSGSVMARSADALIDFTLKDQFDVEHSREAALGKVVFILGSDGDGSSFNDAWGSAVHAGLEDHPRYDELHQLPYADLRSVPFFAKGIARGMMPEEPENWVLLDWKGTIAKAYDFREGATNMLVFASDGKLTGQFAGTELEPTLVNQVVAELRRQLDNSGQ